MNRPSAESPTVAVVGGGLAGLAAGCALSEAGFRVTLFERRPFLGGRASSYQHPGTGEMVDNCQHVLLGCCTNLIAFYERAGVADKIRWYDRLTFLEPGGRASEIGASLLPAPFHTAPSFLAADCLGIRDKVAIAHSMLALIPSTVKDTGESFLDWLKRHRQTELAIERFWKTVLVSALNEDLDRISVAYAAQVFRESFLKSRAAGRVGVPTVPLTELYHAAGSYICARQGDVRFRSAVDTFRAAASEPSLSINGQEFRCDYLVLAVRFDQLSRLLSNLPEAQALRESLTQFEPSPIAGIHLWFDRQISELDHAVLLNRTIQWMFHKSRIQSEIRGDSDGGSYVELVVSSAKTLVNLSKNEIVELAVRELREFFPAAREAQLVKSTVIKEIHATFSPGPGVDRFRPTQTTASELMFLAGDWTATRWPATMEGAVRSGYRAAEAFAQTAKLERGGFVIADLHAAGMMRWFG